jgi:hypothetical protein
MFNTRGRILFVGAALAATALTASRVEGAERKVVLEGKFGQIVSNAVSKPSTPTPDEPIELGQEVRVDQLTGGDADWNGATLTLYEQNVTFKTNGNYRAYGVITKEEAAAYLVVSGEWKVLFGNDGQMIEAPFAADGNLVGGIGKFKGIKGPLTVKGAVTPDNGGVYLLEIAVAE